MLCAGAKLPRTWRHKGAEILPAGARKPRQSKHFARRKGAACRCNSGAAQGWSRSVAEGSPIMSSTDVQAAPTVASPGMFARLTKSAPAATTDAKVSAFDAVMPEAARGKERFIPVTRFALLDRLTVPDRVAAAARPSEARRFFRYLDYWRRQQYNAAADRARADLRAVQPRQRPADDAHVHAGRARRHAEARRDRGHDAHPRRRPTTCASIPPTSSMILTRESALRPRPAGRPRRPSTRC